MTPPPMNYTPPCSYGDDPWDDRGQLRATVMEVAADRCEHPVPPGLYVSTPGRCPEYATEMAHIKPRGMGHTGYRDTLNNVMAACPLHARSTDDRGHEAWQAVPPPHDRIALREWVAARRRAEGWAV